MRFFRIGFSVVLVLLGSPGWADSLNAVLVEAAPILPQTGDVELSETTGASSLITGEALTRPGATLAQVLGREAGTQIRQSGGLGSYSSATLRGSSSDQVMVYLDGLLLNDASGGGFNLSNIELMQAEAIEIYRGATPVQLNTASLGG
ncbi:MAG TPA: TonB-dependent receptor, partial [Gammaproteobacteria bacterium]|nr:TonB-dependent receptor [Gammaproteobacteria bacterium]